MAKREQKKRAEAPTSPLTPMVQPTGGGPQPTPTSEQQAQAQMQAKQQRARTEVAILKQRFAETDVALTIATAERDQLIQQLRASQQTIEHLSASLAEATAPETTPAPEEDEKSDGKDGEEA